MVVGALVYAALLAGAIAIVWRRPAAAIYAFIVGLAVHNAILATLYWVGVRGTLLLALQAWKEVLLGSTLAAVAFRSLRVGLLPLRPNRVDLFAAAFALFVLTYALIPQEWLGGEANAVARLYAVRHDLACVAAYLLGRTITLPPVRRVVLVTAAGVAAVGLLEIVLFPIEWWRDARVPDYFRYLGFDFPRPRRTSGELCIQHWGR